MRRRRRLTQLERQNERLVVAVVRLHVRNIDHCCGQGDGRGAFEQLRQLVALVRSVDAAAVHSGDGDSGDGGSGCGIQRMECVMQQISLKVLRAFLIPREKWLPQNGMGSAVDIAAMEQVLRFVRTAMNLRPTADHFNAVAEAHLQVGATGRAEEILMEQERSNVHTVELMVQCRCARAEWESALRLVEERQCGEHELARCLCKARQCDRNSEEWKRTARRVLLMSTSLSSNGGSGGWGVLLLELAIVAKETAAVQRLFQEVRSLRSAQNDGVPGAVYDMMVHHMLDLGKRSTALDLINEAIAGNRCSVRCYDALLSHLLGHRQYDRMDEVRANMVQNEVAPSAKTINVLMRAVVASERQMPSKDQKRQARELVQWGTSEAANVVWDHATVLLVAHADRSLVQQITQHQQQQQRNLLSRGSSPIHPIDTQMTHKMLRQFTLRQRDAAQRTHSKRTRVTRIMHSTEVKLRRAVIEDHLDSLFATR